MQYLAFPIGVYFSLIYFEQLSPHLECSEKR